MQDILSDMQDWDVSGIVEENRLKEAYAESGGSIPQIAEKLRLPKALTTLLLVRFGILEGGSDTVFNFIGSTITL